MAKVGDKVPSATLRMLGPEGPKAVTTQELFAPRKKVVAFALPGAFTPPCSAKHVPGFVAEAEKLKAKGVDTIACISVNDAFVMGAWGKDQKAGDKVMMLGDGNGEFARVNSPLPSPSIMTLSPAFWSLPQAPITNASFTEMQAMVSTPFAFSFSASATNPGTCFAEQGGVNAPGRAKATTFLRGAKSSWVVTAFGPSGPSMRSVALGTLSPTFAIIWSSN